jgi:hypothetical protein
VVDSLKVLDPNRPIREADIVPLRTIAREWVSTATFKEKLLWRIVV